MKFNMSISDNYASFVDKETGVAVFVDSFDNREFSVRIGTITESEAVGSIIAATTEELNNKLKDMFSDFQGEK